MLLLLKLIILNPSDVLWNLDVLPIAALKRLVGIG